MTIQYPKLLVFMCVKVGRHLVKNRRHMLCHVRSLLGALKLDTYSGRDVIPLWVADMDLKTSPAITDALKKRVDHGIFGYSFPTEGVKTAVMNYYKASLSSSSVLRSRSFLFFNKVNFS